MTRRYSLVRYGALRPFLTQSDAASFARQGGIGLVMAGKQPKTAVFMCPSGCGEVLRINLARESGRAWRARLDSDGSLTLSPSVDLDSGCRCHFVMARSTARVIHDLPEYG